MLTTSTVSGSTESGSTHRVRIGRGFGDVRYIECDTCGHRQMAQFAARSKADEHLASHGVTQGQGVAGEETGTVQELSPAPWVLGLLAMMVVLAMAVAGTGQGG
ncbi:hypothetical protein GCM10009716_37770 [Streptomyces sodiiphilus]|uniref:Uncharacterized protein n=1 Tax=Streptomyces sodiiphilus TaxID=226217 RepID=A0ABN2PNM6_9ACTN